MDLYQIYLIELLTLFADKGVAIQNAAISNHHAKVRCLVDFIVGMPIVTLYSWKRCPSNSPHSCFPSTHS